MTYEGLLIQSIIKDAKSKLKYDEQEEISYYCTQGNKPKPGKNLYEIILIGREHLIA